MKTRITTFLVAIALSSSFVACTQSKSDESEIRAVIEGFSSGVDQQKGIMISDAFREGAGFYATNNRDKIISVTPTQLADMHDAKKFGGRKRNLSIEEVDITDDIVASAKVIAQDDVVYYAYYVTLSKIEGKWLIQSVLQHSKKKV
ncbi:MAG: nuclear transport factor 2 family protein [Cyclobacteriaceae bacterium]